MNGRINRARVLRQKPRIRWDPRRLTVLIPAAALVFMLLSAGTGFAGSPDVVKLAGGPEIIFDQRSGSDVVCITAAVNVGSVCEGPETRGASHLIEHMVFDGSELYSREEISGWVDDAGGFLNAFTRKEITVYFLLVPSVHFEKGIEILSQMLLHSVFLPQELEKERKVILEEIRRESDDPASVRERIVDGVIYRGSRLAEPVIGFSATVETMNETALRAFYTKYYVSSNMRIMITGDFDRARSERLVDEYFPGGPDGSRIETSAAPQWSGETALRCDAALESGIDVLVPFPCVSERSFPAALLVAGILDGDGSPLAAKLKALSLPAPDVGIEIYRGFSALRIRVGAAESGTDAYRKIPAVLESLADWKPAKEELEKARMSFLSTEMFDREMYHFYVMSRGEAIALHGERYLAQCDAAARVTERDCARLVKQAFRPLRFNACLIQKESAPGVPPRQSGTPAIEVLGNGCTVGAISRPLSPVAALHILIKGRACSEGAAPLGLPEMAFALLESSAAGRALSQRLEVLGARVQFGDNPYVPQDDYLLSPAFAFIRLEAPARSIGEAAILLMSHLLSSVVTTEDLDEVKQSLAREVGMRSASPYYALRSTMMGALLGSHPYAAPLFPAPGSMMRVSIEELQALRTRLFGGGNIIATLVSPEAPERGCELLRNVLGGVPAGAAVECPSLPDSVKAASIEKRIRKEGAYIAAGWLARNPKASVTASLIVAGEVLSRRMQLELRERRGLSYSIECSVTPLPGGAVAVAYLEARAALEQEVRLMRERFPGAEEVEIAKSRLLGKRSRSELSSINAAYVLGFDLLLSGFDDFQSMKGLIAAVGPEDVRRAVEGTLVWDAAAVVQLVPEASPGR
jgi:predicted Zn-dependent peptidase